MLASAQMIGCADEGGACGAGEVQALAFQRLGASPSVSTVQDWWLVNPATGPRYAISRCGDEVITLPRGVGFTPLADGPSVLFCDEDGLQRIDLGEDGDITQLHGAKGCSVGPADGVGGFFFQERRSQEFARPYLLTGVSGPIEELWHVTDPTTPMRVVQQVHLRAMGPFKMADGWYLRTEEGAWDRIELDTNELVPVQSGTRFIVPNRGGDAWAWAGLSSAVTADGVDTFVRRLSGGDVAIGAVPELSSLTWNDAGTHLIMLWDGARGAFPVETWNIVGIDARTGARTAVLAGAEGWNACSSGPVIPLETGFLVCQALANSTENLRFSFDPATGALTPRQDGKPARPTWPDRQSGDQGYYPVGDGRFITGQSLPGYPMRDPNSATSSEVDYRQMYLIDSEAETRVALMKMLATDIMFISLELDAIGFTDATRGGFYIRPLPKR